MPTGSKVDRCYQKLRGKKGKGSAAAMKSTRQSPASGKKLPKKNRD